MNLILSTISLQPLCESQVFPLAVNLQQTTTGLKGMQANVKHFQKYLPEFEKMVRTFKFAK